MVIKRLHLEFIHSKVSIELKREVTDGGRHRARSATFEMKSPREL